MIEPLTRPDLERPWDPRPCRASRARYGSVVAEQQRISGRVKSLADGPERALQRMAELLKTVFDASYVAVEIRQLLATAGTASGPCSGSDPVPGGQIGTVALGRCTHGSYAASTAARLADYARLIEAVVSVCTSAHWQNLAWSDDLSHLRNRRYFDQRCDELLAHCARQRVHLTILLLDLDDFKSYNDRLGHATGDALLREVAYLLTHCSREADIVARYGGDEFAILFWDAEKARVPGSRHPSDPLVFAERFCQAIRTHSFRCLGPNSPGEVTVSGGLATFPWDGTTREELMRAADAALRESETHRQEQDQAGHIWAERYNGAGRRRRAAAGSGRRLTAALRILHTADSHIGADLPRRSGTRYRRGFDFVDSFRRALARASEAAVDLVIHAGDLFDMPDPTEGAIGAACEPIGELARAGIPVVIVPGNHERSVLPHLLLLNHPNIYVVREPMTVVIESGGGRIAVAGFPCIRRRSAAEFAAAVEATGWRHCGGRAYWQCIRRLRALWAGRFQVPARPGRCAATPCRRF